MRLNAILLCCALFGLAGCDTDFIEDPGTFCPGDPERVCYTDADCVPDACCGLGTCSVHVDDEPSCATVRCDGSCDPSTVDCGCGLPVCRDGVCTVARTVGEGC